MTREIKFLTPCLVRVDDAKKRRRLLIWLQEIGYDLYQSARSLNYPILCCNMIDDEPGNVYGEYAEELTGLCGIFAYDCGDNIELFKALAAMNDENDYMQWYVNEITDRWSLCIGMDHVEDDPIISKWEGLARHKATAEEIIKHFKK